MRYLKRELLNQHVLPLKLDFEVFKFGPMQLFRTTTHEYLALNQNVPLETGAYCTLQE